MSVEARCLSQGPVLANGLRHHCRLPLGHPPGCVYGPLIQPEGLASDEALLWSAEPTTALQVAINCLLTTIAQERKMREQWSHYFDTLMYALVCIPSEGVEAGVAKAHEIQRERDDARSRARTAAQTLIAEIGASGPENVEETAVRASATIAQERKAVAVLRDAMGYDQPWPLAGSLEKLVEAADILLRKKDYDGHGYEQIVSAQIAAKNYAALIRKALAS